MNAGTKINPAKTFAKDKRLSLKMKMRFLEQQCSLDFILKMQKGKVRNGGLCSHLVYWFPHECGKRVFDFSHFDGTESAGCFILTDNPNPMPACMV